MIAGFASVLGKQARGTVLLEATQQTKHLTPLQADQHTGVSNTQTTRLNPQQHLKPAELLLAHRQHRQGAPPGTPEPGGVSPLSCRGVSSLYCAYTPHVRVVHGDGTRIVFEPVDVIYVNAVATRALRMHGSTG